MERGRVFLFLCVCISLVTCGKLKQAPESQFSDDIRKSNNSHSFKTDLTSATDYPMKENDTDETDVPSTSETTSTTKNLLNQISTDEMDTLSMGSSTYSTNNPLDERKVENLDVLSTYTTGKPVNEGITGKVDFLLKPGLTSTTKNLLTESNSDELNFPSKKLDTRSFKTPKASSITSRLKKNSATQNRRRRVYNSKKSNRDSASRKIKKISYNKEYYINNQAKINVKPINKNGYNDGELMLRENYPHYVATKKPSTSHHIYKKQAESGAINKDQPDILIWDPSPRLHYDTDSKNQFGMIQFGLMTNMRLNLGKYLTGAEIARVTDE
ncbi:hypothetical protein J6590_037042 [Homalodisca vitripennis]|nr:hypothetical protein J6590_037042 [Homalodisca vitripennis]